MASFTDATPTAPRNWQDRRDFGRGNQIQELGGSRGGLAGLVAALRKGGLGGGMNPGDSPIGGRGWAGLNPGVGGGSLGTPGFRDTPPGLIGRSSEPDYGTGPRIGRSSEPDYGTGLPTQFDAGGRSGAQLRSDWAALDPTAQTAAYKQFQTASPEMQASVLAATGVDAQGNVLPTPGSYTGGGIKQLRGNSKAFNAMGAPTQASARPSSQDLMGMMGPAATAATARGGDGMLAGGGGLDIGGSRGNMYGKGLGGSRGGDGVGEMQMQGPTSLGPEYGGTMGGGGPQPAPRAGTADYASAGGGGALGGGGGLQGLAGPQGRPQPNRRPSSQDIMSMYG